MYITMFNSAYTTTHNSSFDLNKIAYNNVKIFFLS